MDKSISIRLEGGIGDHLLQNRFVYAIKQQNPDYSLKIYSDTEGSSTQINLLCKFFPSLYKNFEVIPTRKSKSHPILTQFGEENYLADIDNLPDDILEKMSSADKFYNLCLDNMDWIYQDFNWQKWFLFFPSPEVEPPAISELPAKYILCNFFSRFNSSYFLKIEYIETILHRITEEYDVIIPTTKEGLDFYQKINNKRVRVIEASLEQFFTLSKYCLAFIGVDSGVRCIPYYYNKPTFFFTNYVQEYGNVPVSHLLRWGLYPKTIFPMYYDSGIVCNILLNAINNPMGNLYPDIPLGNLDNIIIKRLKK